MTTFRTPSARFVLISLLVSFLGPFAAGVFAGEEVRPASVDGTVQDGLGNGLEEAQVFLLAVHRPEDRPVAEVRTGADGRYRLGGVEPGVYRVAAVKEGYLTTFQRINTALRSTAHLILHPLPPPDELDQPLPDNEAWALRLPRKSVLRDEGAEVLLGDEDRDGSTVARASRRVDVVDGSVEQLFAVAGISTGSGESTDVQGSETRVNLSAAVRDRGRVVIRGRRDSLRGTSSEDDERFAVRDNAALEFGLAYDTGFDSMLDVNAFYAQEDLDVAIDGAGQHAQRSWGCDASWSKQIDPTASVQVRLDYRSNAIDLPTEFVAGYSPPGHVGTAAFSNSMVGAEGSYRGVAGQGHEVRVGMRAQLLQLPVPVARVSGIGAFAGTPAETGWSVRIDAEDAWRVSGPVTVLYGLTYHNNVESADWSVVVPRAGAVWNPRWFKIKGMVSYHSPRGTLDPLDALDALDALDPTGVSPKDYEQRIGYDLALDAPLPLGFRAVGTVSYEPAQYGYAGYVPGGIDDRSRPIYLTDGNAESWVNSLMFERPFGRTDTWVQVSRGRVEGTLAQIPVFATPVHVLDERSLEYSTGRIGAHVPAWGTDFVAEYQRVEDGQIPGVGTSLSSQEYFEFRIAQHLIWLESAGSSWRVLLAARTVSTGEATSEFAASSTSREGSGVDSLFNRQISAGVAVVF